MKYFVAFVSIGIALVIFILPQNTGKTLAEKQELHKPSDRPNLRQLVEGRGAHEFLMTHDPKTNSIPRDRLLPAKEYTRQLLSRKSAIANVNWEERGPNNVSGRTRAILIDAGDVSGNTVFASGVGGGLWKTTDGGATWNQVDDFFDNLAICSITQDPNDSDIIYFGTGEGFGNSDSIRGLGIWKSEDGGLTFTQLAATNNNSDFFFVTSMLAVDSSGVTKVLACTRSGGGIFKSRDAGATWSLVLFGNTGEGKDMTLASNGDVYAALGGSNGPDGIYKSTDAGQMWTQVYTSAGNEGRIELAAAPSNSDVIYALLENRTNGGVPTIRRTADAGTSWPNVNTPTWFDQNCGVPNPDWTRTQDWYDLIAVVDPNDDDRVFIGGVDLFGTTDGGTSWTQISSWAGACSRQFVHADQHALVFVGNSSDDLWSGNDGGVFKTADATSTIPAMTFVGDGYNITQFYACDLHPDEGIDYFLAGAQDNGTQKFQNAGLNNTSSATGGDGAFCHIDQDDPNIQITSFTRNNYSISTNGGATFGAGPRENTGLFINPTDYDDELKKLYGAWSGAAYFRWNNPSAGGNNWESVGVTTINGSVTHVRTSPNVSDRVYFGTNTSRVVRVNGASTGATNVGTIIFEEGQGATISCVEIEEGDESHMLVTLSNYGVISIYESTNATNVSPTWTNIENNLPDIPVRWVLFNPDDADQALVATELGVWSTDNINGASTDWAPTNANLANTRVDMLKIRESDNTVIAATHGRGLFSTKAFDHRMFFTKTAVTTANANDEITYNFEIFNNKVAQVTNVTITDILDAGLTIIPESLTCGTVSGNTITINQGTMGPNTIVNCSYKAIAKIDNFTTLDFEDDIESGAGNWSITNPRGAATWSITNTNSNSPTHSWFVPNAGDEDNTEYITLDAMVLSGSSILSFYHSYDTEEDWDGGIVEISTNGGGSWTDLGPFMIENPYNGSLGGSSNPDIAGRSAFTGNSNGFIRTTANLSSFGSQSVLIRFLFGEDNNTFSVGWFVDDVQLLDAHIIPNIASLTTTQGDALADTVYTIIFECETLCYSCGDGIQNGDETSIDFPCKCTEEGTTLIYDNTTIIDGTDEHIKESITTMNSVIVEDGSDVNLRAGNYLEIGSGFQAELGSTIEMQIEDCFEIPPAQSEKDK